MEGGLGTLRSLLSQAVLCFWFCDFASEGRRETEFPFITGKWLIAEWVDVFPEPQQVQVLWGAWAIRMAPVILRTGIPTNPCQSRISKAARFLPSEWPACAAESGEDQRRSGNAFWLEVPLNCRNNECGWWEIACLALQQQPAEERAMQVRAHSSRKGWGSKFFLPWHKRSQNTVEPDDGIWCTHSCRIRD